VGPKQEEHIRQRSFSVDGFESNKARRDKGGDAAVSKMERSKKGVRPVLSGRRKGKQEKKKWKKMPHSKNDRRENWRKLANLLRMRGREGR